MAMKDWQIGVLIVIIVVFIILCTVLCGFIYYVWRRGREAQRNGTTTHHQNKRMNMYIYNQDTNHPPTIDPKVKPNGHTLYYIDLDRKVRSIDFKKVSIHTGQDLQQQLARQCGLDHPETLTLTYVNPHYQFIEMDLDLLVQQDDQLARRLQHTGERPLYLGRVASTPPALVGGLQPYSGNDGQNNNHNNNRNIEVNLRSHGQYSGGLPPPPPAGSPYAGGFAPVSVEVAADPSGRAPVPIVVPARSHITTSTPIYITAPQYFFPSDRTPLRDRDTVAALEEFMCGRSPPRPLFPTTGPLAGTRLEGMPDQGIVMVYGPSSAPEPRMLRRVEDSIVRYTTDRRDSNLWERYRGPFRLPPGRWCVRAKASSPDEQYTSTVGKVYSVDID